MERSNDVKCVLCGRNHPANYKGCIIYKALQQKTYPSLRPKQYLPPATLQRTLHTSPNIMYAQIAKHTPSHYAQRTGNPQNDGMSSPMPSLYERTQLLAL
jgi:hypothetical protein